jgi:hypothetical protein
MKASAETHQEPYKGILFGVTEIPEVGEVRAGVFITPDAREAFWRDGIPEREHAHADYLAVDAL